MTTTYELASLLLEVEKIAHDLGRAVLALPPPPPFRTLAELRPAFEAIDQPLQQRARDQLRRLRPDAAWADELDGALPTTGDVWVVDAIDGAVQYLHGLPQWCVSIALVRDGVPIAAVLHSAVLGETYAASAGGGATRNSTAIRPSAKAELAAALVATSQPPFAARYPDAIARAASSLAIMLTATGAVRNLGATSWQVADVAAGRLDAFWEYGPDDINVLGATLIAREAGAVVSDARGQPWRAGTTSIVVAAPALHAPLLARLAAIA
jgi:myo-inositol-1(or 4)-monophosphatase